MLTTLGDGAQLRGVVGVTICQLCGMVGVRRGWCLVGVGVWGSTGLAVLPYPAGIDGASGASVRGSIRQGLLTFCLTLVSLNARAFLFQVYFKSPSSSFSLYP